MHKTRDPPFVGDLSILQPYASDCNGVGSYLGLGKLLCRHAKEERLNQPLLVAHKHEQPVQCFFHLLWQC